MHWLESLSGTTTAGCQNPITFRNKSGHGSFLPLVWACVQTKTVLAGGTGGPFSFARPAVASNCKLWPCTQLLACGLVLDIDRSNICRKFGNELKTCAGALLRMNLPGWGLNALAGIIVWGNHCGMRRPKATGRLVANWKWQILASFALKANGGGFRV